MLFATQYEVSYKGFSFDICKYDYLSYYYDQVRASENWTEAVVSEVTYVYGYVSSAKVSSDHNKARSVNRVRPRFHLGFSLGETRVSPKSLT